MKFFKIFGVLLIFGEAKDTSQGVTNSGLQKAFSNILEASEWQNNLVTVVAVGDIKSIAVESIASAAFSGVPCIIKKWIKMEDFRLNSSAIVFLDSIA